MAKRATMADVERMVKALEAVGKPLAAVDVLPGGVVRLLIGKPVDVGSAAKDAPNEWDEVLPGAA